MVLVCLLPDNINRNPTNKKTDQCLSDFQTGTGAAAHDTLNTEQLIPHARMVLVDTTASLQDSQRGVIQVQKDLNYSLRFMIFWTMLCLSDLGIHLIFWHPI